MPIVTQGSVEFTINDLVPSVVAKVENRNTPYDQARAVEWLRDALVEISSNPSFRNEFLELEQLGPTWNLTPPVGSVGVQEYPDINLALEGNINWATLDIMLWMDYPTNAVRRQLDNKNYQSIDRYQQSLGTPVYWYRAGTNIGFYPVPNAAYQVQGRVLIFHPIADTSPGDTAILLPRDWNEILVLAAVERGYMELEEHGKAAATHNFLFGDPKYPTRPGLIAGRKQRREQENWRRESQLKPKSRPYSYGYRR